MGTEDHGSNDFRQAMGEEFSAAVSPPVAFDDVSAHDCCEAIRQALGHDVTPMQLAGLGEAELRRLADAFGDWFGVPPSASARLRNDGGSRAGSEGDDRVAAR